MTELLEDLDQKRMANNNEAEKHRKLRDELNEKTKEWVQKRDELNAEVRKLVDEAAKHRELRDQLNEQVRAAKAVRDEKNKIVRALDEKVAELKKATAPKETPKDGAQQVPISKLKKDLKQLEFYHQSQALTKDKEKEIVEKMKALSLEIKEKEKASEQSAEVKNAIKELREAREAAEAEHKKVSELAERAQAEHDIMIQLYEKADALRKEADKAQEMFLQTKNLADEEHHKHIESIRQVHDYDKIITGLRQKAKKARRKKDDTVAQKEAEDIFEKFKKGEKLSTEDLMMMQKSGYN
ncbi:MAG: phosphoserine phosphatase [Methanomassiliicoccales archaeon]|nr:MAG: phosphoserine phosphatase [Methanomassiliicoccales archaeon]